MRIIFNSFSIHNLLLIIISKNINLSRNGIEILKNDYHASGLVGIQIYRVIVYLILGAIICVFLIIIYNKISSFNSDQEENQIEESPGEKIFY